MDESTSEDSNNEDNLNEGFPDDYPYLNQDQEDFVIPYGENNANGQYSTAISKLQISLNDLINCHKAPLQLYDDIVNLTNEYTSLPYFSKYA